MLQEKSAGIILFSGAGPRRKYLLLHYGAGHWSFPKGHVEAGEDEREAALRELDEETGISEREILFVGGFLEKIEYFFKKGGETIHKRVLFYLAKTAKPTPAVKLSFEHTAAEWLSYRQAFQKISFNSDKSVLQKAREFLDKRKGGVQRKLV